MTPVSTQNKCSQLDTQSLRKLINGVADLISSEHLTSSTLTEQMINASGDKASSGAWSWRQAYDIMQAGAALALRNDASQQDTGAIVRLARSLLTETRRSEAQIRLQQFSTPLPYAHLAATFAALRADDLVLEPSAGTGTLAHMAHAYGAKLILNELDPFRANILRAVHDLDVTCHDAEHIDDLLGGATAPSVVLMNPPFASSQNRGSDRHMAAKHVISSANRLAPGGRLVAILPVGFSEARDPTYWSKLCTHVTPRMSLIVPGSTYRKMGTSVDTCLCVFDKVQGDDTAYIVTHVDQISQAYNLIATSLAPRAQLGNQRIQKLQTRGPTSGQYAVSLPQTPRRGASSSLRKAPARHKNRLIPLTFDVFDTPRENDPVSDIYARYAPQRIDIEGAMAHPTPLVESIAMASVAPPAPSKDAASDLRLPERLITEGILSDAQLETIIMANDAHARDLPGRFVLNDDETEILRRDDDDAALAYRLGYFLGDGTGCGKGRECAGLIMVNWLAGRRRHVWISKSATLIEDAVRDWSDLGGSPADIQNLSKWNPDDDIKMGDGILFVTYATLRSVGKTGATRLNQLLDWLGRDFDGVIGFDEAHAMQNAAGSDEGRGAKPSQQGLAGLRLQLALPRARVFYISATGATTVHNLAYAPRLGLWGQGPEYPFPSRAAFVSAMEAGGVAAMEVVARDLKTLGFYTARALSFDGVEYDLLEHELTQAQTEIYNAYAKAFRTIHHNLDAALEATGVIDADGSSNASAARASARSRFESTKQRFFNHLLMGMKAPSIIAGIEADIADGWACVVQIVSTGESLLKRRLETMHEDDELVEGALTPRDYVLSYLETAFPVHANKIVEVEGNMVAEPLRDKHGALVISREAMALRNQALEELMTLAPIPAALDQILWAFGAEQVAEVTGRSIRPLKADDASLYIEKRTASSNFAETAAFMDGEKDILIFSDAGGTGRSYHAAQSAKNQKRRRHYLVEPGWRADAAIQGLGRTHRSAQVSAPFFRVCTSDVHGEKRFTSTICKRMDTLGALSKGQRETGSQGMFREDDNLESPIARSALRGYYSDLISGRAGAMSYETFYEWTALRLMDSEGVMLDELPPIQRFLNRVLALPIHMQNALFEEFMQRIADQTEQARAKGILDIGIETLRGENIAQVSADDLWTCPQSGAVTRIIGLEITDTVHITFSEEALQLAYKRRPYRNAASGRAALISPKPFQVYDEDQVTLMRKITRPTGSKYITETDFQKSAWETVKKSTFTDRWDQEARELPTTEITKLYLLTGLLLPIWKDIPTSNERIYRVTPEGGTAMIGRTLGEDGAKALRARFMTGTPETPAQMLDVALNSTATVNLGGGLSLKQRRVAGEVRLEISGADRERLTSYKAYGCFTEIIAFQLRLFVPHGKDVDTLAILQRIVGPTIAKKPAIAA
jgi:hypothetical protein